MIVRHARRPSDLEFQAYLDQTSELLARQEPYAIVHITEPDAPITKPAHARLQAKWLKENKEPIGRLCIGMAFVLPSPLMRGTLKAILSMQALPCEFEVFATEDEGFDWIERHLPVTQTGS